MIVCVMAKCRDFLHYPRDCQHVNKDSATQSLLVRVKFNCHVKKVILGVRIKRFPEIMSWATERSWSFLYSGSPNDCLLKVLSDC